MTEPRDVAPEDPALPCLALAQTLDRLHQVLGGLSDAQYAAPPTSVPTATSAIGAHVRHCLDHVEALLASFGTGLVAYDRRDRGTPVESDRQVAIEVLTRQIAQLRQLDAARLAKPVDVEVTVAADQPPISVSSSYARELAFVLSHSVHHHALIGVLAAAAGYTVPTDFLYAPATLAWMDRDACAHSP